jgi:hypothetical protein
VRKGLTTLLATIILMIVTLGLSGCDGMFSTKQSLELQILDRTSGKGVEGYVVVAIDPKTLPVLQKEAGTLNTGRSDATGNVKIDVDTSVIVGGPFAESQFGALTRELGDRLTGQQYVVQVRSSQKDDVIELKLNPKAKGEGEAFTVEVISIEPAERLQTPNGREVQAVPSTR